MKIKIEVDPQLEKNEVILRCPEINNEVLNIQKQMMNMISQKTKIIFYQKEKEFYFPVHKVLFFETAGNVIEAHTAKNVFLVKYKLYELEEIVPAYFLRVSKSAILNAREIYSITKNLTASSIVEFQNTHKKVYVSRNYYKILKGAMERR